MVRHNRSGEKENVNQKTEWPFSGSQAREVESVQPFSGPQEMESGVCKLLFIKAQVKECCVGRMRLSCLWRDPFKTCLGRTYPVGSYCWSAAGSYIFPFTSWLDKDAVCHQFCLTCTANALPRKLWMGLEASTSEGKLFKL
jgi:hypothetical protein